SEARPQPAARRENFRDDQAESWQMPQRKGLGASEPLPKMSQSAPFISRRTSDDDQAANLAGVLANAHGERHVPQFDNADIARMMAEIRSMRGMLESQLSELTWSGQQQQRDPARKEVLRLLLAAGFSASLSRYLVENMPARMARDKARAWIKSTLVRNLASLNDESAILEQ